MLTYADIATLVAAGQTAEQIAEALAQDYRTHRDLPVDQVRVWLYTEWRLVVTDPVTRQRSGPLIDLYAAETTPTELREGIATLLAHLDDPTAETVQTASRADYAALWFATVAMLGLSSDRLAALESLHGGRRFADVTAELVQAVIDAEAERTRRAELSSRLNAAIAAGAIAIEQGGVEAEVRSAMLAAFDGEAMT